MFREKLVRRPFFEEIDDVLSTEVTETCGTLFPDGLCIELVKDSEGRLSLLDSNHKKATESIHHLGKTYVPATIDPSILEALILPMERADHGSTADLFGTIHKLFVGHNISDEVAQRLTFFVLSTWFTEFLPMAPCLIITGPEAEARIVLRLLRCIVRHALSLGDIPVAGFRRLPMHIQPTLLIGHLHPSMLRTLSTSNYPEAYVPSGNGLIDLYSAKVVYAGTALVDKIPGDGFLNINIGPCHGKIPTINLSSQQQIVADFQSRLLDYRLAHVVKVRDSDFDLPALPSSLRVLARALGACVVDAPELQADVALLLECQQDLLRANQWIDPQCVVVEALLAECHTKQGAFRVGVGQIADMVNAILKDRGETILVVAKLMGSRLRLLGFLAKRDGQGYAIYLTDDVRRQIHKLERDLQIATAAQSVTTCPQCVEIIAIDQVENVKHTSQTGRQSMNVCT